MSLKSKSSVGQPFIEGAEGVREVDGGHGQHGQRFEALNCCF